MSTPVVHQLRCLGYSGSSVLNLLLDSIEDFRGLGEIDRLFNRDPTRPCILCWPNECKAYGRIRPDRFYLGCARVYPGTRFLVDSSKRPEFYEARQSGEPRLHYRSILLFKTPHAYLYSWTGHMPKDKHPDEVWKLWADFHAAQIGKADVVVWYRNLARDPERELQRILGHAPRFRRERWWDTDTHVIGGNTAVMSQKNRRVEAESRTFEAERQENSGRRNKYRHRRHAIFVDENWRRDEPFKALMDDYYRNRGAEIDTTVARLGMSVEWLREDLWGNFGF
ncbi:MAG: hypothetical protein HUU20_26905 [Pirellulales bacterium]|nr:hypothetical protein [Pirellulales bacterium]